MEFIYQIRCTFASKGYAIFDVTYYENKTGKALSELKIIREENWVCKRTGELLECWLQFLGTNNDEIKGVLKEVEEKIKEKATDICR